MKKSLAKLPAVLEAFLRHEETFKAKGDPNNEKHVKYVMVTGWILVAEESLYALSTKSQNTYPNVMFLSRKLRKCFRLFFFPRG